MKAGVVSDSNWLVLNSFPKPVDYVLDYTSILLLDTSEVTCLVNIVYG